VLSQHGELTSFQIKVILEKSVRHFWPISHTTAYEEPARLIEDGYLSATQEKGGRRRRRYALTNLGREALEAWLADPGAEPPQLHDELLLKVFAGADPGALSAERIEVCEARQRDLLAHQAELSRNQSGAGPAHTLSMVIRYNRSMLESMKAFHEVTEDGEVIPSTGCEWPILDPAHE
jgi:PadR family transcriptional regulator AphA